VTASLGKQNTGRNLIAVILVAVMFLSSTFTAVAWSDFTQSKTNVFRGTVAKTAVTLHKYEMNNEGTISAIPVRGAEFELYMLNTDGTDKKIGGTYVTNNSGKITVEKLNSGRFKFVETKPGYGYDYVLDDSGNPITEYSFTVTADDSLGQAMVEVDAYNRRLTSSLEVKKTVEGTGADLTKLFEFEISLSDGNLYKYKINGTGDLKTLDSGKFYLKHGECAVFEGLPVGVYYQIVETPDPQYFTQSTNNQGTIRSEEKSNAGFKNTYIGADTGRLEIKKTVSGDGAETDRAFEFKVTFSVPGTYSYKNDGTGEFISFTNGGTLNLKHNQTAVFEDVPVDVSYTVVETSDNMDGYTASVKDMSGKIIPGTVQAVFDNHKDNLSPKPGSLEIRKTISGAGASAVKEFNFTVTFGGAQSVGKPFPYTINGMLAGTVTDSGVIKLKGGDAAVFNEIPAGVTYNAVEDSYTPDGYIASLTQQSGTIPEGCRAYVAFNNHKEPDLPKTKITVKKIVEGESPEDREFRFSFVKNDGEPLRFSLKAGNEKSFELNIGDTYRVTEDDPFQYGYIQTSAINGTGTAANNEIKITIINKYIGTIWKTIQGEKEWELDEAPDTVIPDSITVLLKNGNDIVETKTVIPNEQGEWLFSFIAQKYDDNGREINYMLGEIPIPGFEITISNDIITNTYVGKKTVTVNKVWNDNNNPARPKEIKVQLYKNDVPEGDPIMLHSDNNWKYTWSELSVAPEWTVDEVDVPEGYSKTLAGSEQTGFIITNSRSGEAGEITINGSKTWNHGENPTPNHPVSINVYVKNGDAVVASDTITGDNHWSWNFKLPKYDEENKLIVYTIDEDPVRGYSKAVDGYDLINTWIPVSDDISGEDTVIISGIKTWNYNGAPENDRPDSIIVYVKKGNKIVTEKTVTAADYWCYSFVLPKFEYDGVTPIRYSIDEANVPHYRHQADGYDLINTYESPDYPGDSPKTGDDSNLWQWIMFLIAGASISIAFAGKKRKTQR